VKALLIPPERSLIDEIIPLLEGADRDYSRNAVIFPGKRPSHFLRKILAGNIKKSFLPPAIFSIDGFIDVVYESMYSDRKLETIDAVSVLFDIHRRTKERLGGDSFITPDSFFSIGLMIYRDIEELYIEGINAYRVKETQPYMEEVIPVQTLQRLQSLSFFYEEFYKTIGERGLSTRSSRYRIAAEKIAGFGTGDYRKAIFAGFYTLTESEKKLFKKLLVRDNTTFIFQDGPGIREKLAELGIHIESKEAKSSRPEIHFYSSPDTHGQVYALNTILTKKEGEDLDEKTAIVLPSSDTLFPLLRQGLPGIDDKDYNISLGYPIHRTSIFGFLNNLMELITSMDEERLYIPEYLKFVLHPYTKNIYFNGSAEITRIMFHSLEEALTKHKTKTFATLREIEGDAKILDNIIERTSYSGEILSQKEIAGHLKIIHMNTIEKFLSFKNVGDFVRKCGEILAYIFNNSTARLHPLFTPFSESFLRSLDAVSRSLIKNMTFMERSSYFTFFRKYTMTCRIPFEGTPVRGLQILGFLETRNLKFERVFILDTNEGILPDTVKEDSLLPLKARQILGLPTYLDRDNLAAYYFETLIKGTKEVHICFVEDDTKERSRFVEKLLWEKQKETGAVEEGTYLKSIQYKVKLDNADPEEIIKTAEVVDYLKNFIYSATALDTYLRCPLQFYYSYVLRLDKKEDMSGEIERADIGKIVHNAISAYFSRRKGFSLHEKDMNVTQMHGVIDELFNREYGENLAGAVYLLKKQIRKHLEDLIKNYYIPLIKKGSFTILDSEREIQKRIDSFNLRGRLDSLEKRGEKTYIIDYKTASNPRSLNINSNMLNPCERETWGKAIGSLQLPLYVMLYLEETHARIQDVGAMFLLLGRSLINPEIELPLFADSEPEKAYDVIKTVILNLLREIVDQRVPFEPTADKKEACPYCDFQYMCGTQWVVR
jgi:ATP-dependent helicase/nuclease subunit B